MSSICSRYPDIVAHEFEIERRGAKGSTDTTYEIFETSHDNTRLEDLPEIQNVIGGIVLDKTAEEMNEYLRTGDFPYNKPAQQQNHQSSYNPVPQRRTPVTGTEVF